MAARDAVLSADDAASSAGGTVSTENAAELSSVESPPAPAPVKEPAATKQQEKPKRKGPVMNIFKRDSGPQRATSVEEAIGGEVCGGPWPLPCVCLCDCLCVYVCAFYFVGFRGGGGHAK